LGPDRARAALPFECARVHIDSIGPKHHMVVWARAGQDGRPVGGTWIGHSSANETVYMKETYNGDSAATREVAEALTVWVAQGAWPQWSLGWNTSIYCDPYFDCDE